MRILVIDIGGTHVKMHVTSARKPRSFDSHPMLTPRELVERVRSATRGWSYDGISLGYPGAVGSNGPRAEPGNLGAGWTKFDFAKAFDRPVRIINDAAMQALGAYDGGRMLFLGLGTGVGSTLISDGVVVPLELGNLPYRPKGKAGRNTKRSPSTSVKMVCGGSANAPGSASSKKSPPPCATPSRRIT